MGSMAVFGFDPPVRVAGEGVACALGGDTDACLAAAATGVPPLRPLGQLVDGGLGLPDLPAGWVDDRRLLAGRRHGAASNLAVRVARQAVEAAGWNEDQRRDAWLWVGTSRGNAGEWTGAWSFRRPVRKFAAGNSMHSEVATAVSLGLGLTGPWQVLTNGCASGIDAAGWAAQSVAAGWTRRALAVAVDLPLVQALIDDFSATGLLSRTGLNDPYHPDTCGFLPGEGAAALAFEGGVGDGPVARAYGAGNDACNAFALPEDGAPLAGLMQAVAGAAGGGGKVQAICPHATGTAAHRVSEGDALARAFPRDHPPLHLLKPFTGHALGASGLVDLALLTGALRRGQLPRSPRALTPPEGGWELADGMQSAEPGGLVMKVAAGLGGHNAALVTGLRA